MRIVKVLDRDNHVFYDTEDKCVVDLSDKYTLHRVMSRCTEDELKHISSYLGDLILKVTWVYERGKWYVTRTDEEPRIQVYGEYIEGRLSHEGPIYTRPDSILMKELEIEVDQLQRELDIELQDEEERKEQLIEEKLIQHTQLVNSIIKPGVNTTVLEYIPLFECGMGTLPPRLVLQIGEHKVCIQPFNNSRADECPDLYMSIDEDIQEYPYYITGTSPPVL